jgi:hypothetical protein
LESFVADLKAEDFVCTYLKDLLKESMEICTQQKEHESIVFFSQPSRGKSFLIDLVLRVTTIPEYCRLSHDIKLQHRMTQALALVQTLTTDDQFTEIKKNLHHFKNRGKDLEKDIKESKKEQWTAKNAIRNTIHQFPSGAKGTKTLVEGSFLLKICDKSSKSTTHFNIIIRFDGVPSIVVKYYSKIQDIPVEQKYKDFQQY